MLLLTKNSTRYQHTNKSPNSPFSLITNSLFTCICMNLTLILWVFFFCFFIQFLNSSIVPFSSMVPQPKLVRNFQGWWCEMSTAGEPYLYKQQLNTQKLHHGDPPPTPQQSNDWLNLQVGFKCFSFFFFFLNISSNAPRNYTACFVPPLKKKKRDGIHILMFLFFLNSLDNVPSTQELTLSPPFTLENMENKVEERKKK